MKQLVALALFVATPLHAEPGLPPEAAVMEALDTHPMVLAARARITAVRAEARGLAVGPQEVWTQFTFQRRDVAATGPVPEYMVEVTRPIRLPGKGSIDRRIGAAAMATSANVELLATRSAVDAIAAGDAALATGYLAAWQQAANEAAIRQGKGHALGGVDLADRLLVERLARDAALDEVRARTMAVEAITRLRIDSHTLWGHPDDAPPP
jgi:hypothetical protein